MVIIIIIKIIYICIKEEKELCCSGQCARLDRKVGDHMHVHLQPNLPGQNTGGEGWRMEGFEVQEMENNTEL